MNENFTLFVVSPTLQELFLLLNDQKTSKYHSNDSSWDDFNQWNAFIYILHLKMSIHNCPECVVF